MVVAQFVGCGFAVVLLQQCPAVELSLSRIVSFHATVAIAARRLGEGPTLRTFGAEGLDRVLQDRPDLVQLDGWLRCNGGEVHETGEQEKTHGPPASESDRANQPNASAQTIFSQRKAALERHLIAPQPQPGVHHGNSIRSSADSGNGASCVRFVRSEMAARGTRRSDHDSGDLRVGTYS